VLNLSPVKLGIVLIVALLVVGPDRIPQVSKQLGAAWRALRNLTSRIEDEVRSSVPDLPSTGDLARFARSPVALLDKLADLDEKGLKPDRSSPAPQEPPDGLIPDPGAPASEEVPPTTRAVAPSTPATGFDPSLN
jgi:sec-independent protein translocase protein TatB